MWGGVSVGDFNNDGWPDLFVTAGGGTTDALFINQGDGTFSDEAAAWGFTSLYRGNGTAVGDYDGDGDLDIYVTSAGDMSGAVTTCANRLYRNNFIQGSSTFTDVGAAAGVNCTATTAEQVFPFGAAFGDYDLDGDLDLFSATWAPSAKTTDGNRLFRNDGDGTFTDVTAAAGVFDTNFHGFSPRFADMNGDRYPELIVAADFSSSRYFKNNGNGTFSDRTASAGVGLDQNGMGSTVGDFNQDGLFDWYVTSIEDRQGNFLYVNQGNDTFSALAASNGGKDGGWGWGVAALDYDNDGDVDIAETNGWFGAALFLNVPTYIFRNDGNLTFTRGLSGINNTDEGRALVTLDFDRDGDLDLVVTTNDDTGGGPI
ncbi:MAG: VCBS repeat-containing protein, partial [Halioglobus sp.]